MTKKNIYKLVLYWISLLCFTILLVGNLYEFVCYFLTSILFVYITKKHMSLLKEHNIVKHIISVILSIIILFFQAYNFCYHISFSSKLNSVCDIFNIDKHLFIIIIAILFSCVSLFSLYFLFRCLLLCLINIFKWICEKIQASGHHTTIFFKNILASFFIVIIASLLGLSCLYGVFLIPTEVMNQHVYESASVMKEEGADYNLSPYCNSHLDIYTDSIMLNNATYQADCTTLEKCLMIYRGTMDGTDAAIDILSEHFLDQIDYDGKQSYSRYWHGYLIFLKPLLLLLNYSQIRIINLICQSILLIIVFLLMLKKQLKELIVPYFIMYLLLMPAALVMNMQFYPCFYLILIGSITVFLFSNQKIFPFVFLLLGVTTSYFDFLTYPFATLGVPLLILIYILIKNGMPNEDLIIIVFQLSVFWGIGYIGMWIMKWLLGSILLGGNVFYDAINAIRFRTSSNYDEFRYSRIGVVFTNVFTFLFSPASLLFISFVLVKSIKKPFNKKSIPLICIIAELACWYMVTVNHCAIHYWFTNKCSAVFVLSIMMCLLISKNSTSKCQNIT